MAATRKLLLVLFVVSN